MSTPEERQVRLDEFAESGQCEAYAESTGERCGHDALAAIPYCGDHKHLVDEVDLERIGLKPSKSGG